MPNYISELNLPVLNTATGQVESQSFTIKDPNAPSGEKIYTLFETNDQNLISNEYVNIYGTNSLFVQDYNKCVYLFNKITFNEKLDISDYHSFINGVGFYPLSDSILPGFNSDIIIRNNSSGNFYPYLLMYNSLSGYNKAINYDIYTGNICELSALVPPNQYKIINNLPSFNSPVSFRVNTYVGEDDQRGGNSDDAVRHPSTIGVGNCRYFNSPISYKDDISIYTNNSSVNTRVPANLFTAPFVHICNSFSAPIHIDISANFFNENTKTAALNEDNIRIITQPLVSYGGGHDGHSSQYFYINCNINSNFNAWSGYSVNCNYWLTNLYNYETVALDIDPYFYINLNIKHGVNVRYPTNINYFYITNIYTTNSIQNRAGEVVFNIKTDISGNCNTMFRTLVNTNGKIINIPININLTSKANVSAGTYKVAFQDLMCSKIESTTTNYISPITIKVDTTECGTRNTDLQYLNLYNFGVGNSTTSPYNSFIKLYANIKNNSGIYLDNLFMFKTRSYYKGKDIGGDLYLGFTYASQDINVNSVFFNSGTIYGWFTNSTSFLNCVKNIHMTKDLENVSSRFYNFRNDTFANVYSNRLFGNNGKSNFIINLDALPDNNGYYNGVYNFYIYNNYIPD